MRVDPFFTGRTKTAFPNRMIAILAICGDGERELMHKDFMLITSDEEREFLIKAKGNELRLIMIEVPTQVNYPVYPK